MEAVDVVHIAESVGTTSMPRYITWSGLLDFACEVERYVKLVQQVEEVNRFEAIPSMVEQGLTMARYINALTYAGHALENRAKHLEETADALEFVQKYGDPEPDAARERVERNAYALKLIDELLDMVIAGRVRILPAAQPVEA